MLTGAILLATLTGGSDAQEVAPGPNDSLNAVLWTQRSVEFKGNAVGAYALARIQLDEALADATHTAAPAEQSGDFENLPPAVILDVDETVLDTSLYQAWTVVDGQAFSPKTWTPIRQQQDLAPDPRRGGVHPLRRREGREGILCHQPHRRGGTRDPREHGSTRLSHGRQCRYLADRQGTARLGLGQEHAPGGDRQGLPDPPVVGDNLGDFSDGYKGDEAARLKVYEDNAAHWGKDWIVIANPTYGSFEVPGSLRA